MNVPFRADVNLELIAPVPAADSSVVITGACIGKHYDPSRANHIAVAVSSGTTIILDDPIRFRAGEQIQIALDSGDVFETTVTSFIEKDRSMVIGGVVPSACKAGARVERKIGANVSMSVYNSANATATTEDWGWRGTILAAHAEIAFGMTCRAERRLVDGSSNVIVQNQMLHFTDVE